MDITILLCFHTKVAAVHVLLDPGHQGLEPDIHGGVVDSAALRHVAPAATGQAQQDVPASMLVTWGKYSEIKQKTLCF